MEKSTLFLLVLPISFGDNLDIEFTNVFFSVNFTILGNLDIEFTNVFFSVGFTMLDNLEFEFSKLDCDITLLPLI